MTRGEKKLDIPNKCSCCDFKTCWSSSLKKHILRKHEQEKLELKECEMCGHKSVTTSELKKHILDKHTEHEKTHRCELCEYKTHRPDSLKFHIQSKHKVGTVRQRCEFPGCDWFTCSTYPSLLKTHMLSHKPRERKADKQCLYCAYKAVTNSALRVHESFKHNKNVMRFDCDLCDIDFKSKGILKTHKRLKHGIGSQLFKCERCDHISNTKGNLKRHVLHNHTADADIKWHHCEWNECNFKSKCSGHLKTHVQSKHLKLRQHACNQCDKSYYRKRDLSDHMNVHTGLRTFSCSKCNKTYARRHVLEAHDRYVHSEKNNCCRFCTRKFAAKSCLEQHENLHTGARPFSCDACDEMFPSRASLGYHIRTRHEDVWISRRKEQEDRVKRALVDAGWTECFDTEAMPLPFHFKREKRIDFRCVDANDTWCRIDFVLGVDTGYVFLEVDENQHRFGYDNDTLACDMKRMSKVMSSLFVEITVMPRILWLRYNPSAWRVDDVLQKKPKRDREQWLISFVGSITLIEPLSIGYAYYDTDASYLQVLGHAEYHEQFAEIAVDLTQEQVVCEACDEK